MEFQPLYLMGHGLIVLKWEYLKPLVKRSDKALKCNLTNHQCIKTQENTFFFFYLTKTINYLCREINYLFLCGENMKLKEFSLITCLV